MDKGILKNKGIEVAKVSDVKVKTGKKYYEAGTYTHKDSDSVTFHSTPPHIPKLAHDNDYSLELENGKALSITITSSSNGFIKALVNSPPDEED